MKFLHNSIHFVIFCLFNLQFGHIYTSFGSFFIQPEEEYSVDNQNILHKITREKLPIKYVAKGNSFNHAELGVSMIDDSAGDDIETMRNENDEKPYEIESTAKTVTLASADDSAKAGLGSIDVDKKDDSHRESLCDTCKNNGNSMVAHFINAISNKNNQFNRNC